VAAEDKGKITEMMEHVPADLAYLKGVNWVHIDRKDKDYFELGVSKIVTAAHLQQEPEPALVSQVLSLPGSASSAGTVDSFKTGMLRIASCRSVLKMDVHTIPEGSDEREEFKKDFAKEMALALSYLVVQKLDAQGVKGLKEVAAEAERVA
jgi:hypothetical protein